MEDATEEWVELVELLEQLLELLEDMEEDEVVEATRTAAGAGGEPGTDTPCGKAMDAGGRPGDGCRVKKRSNSETKKINHKRQRWFSGGLKGRRLFFGLFMARWIMQGP